MLRFYKVLLLIFIISIFSLSPYSVMAEDNPAGLAQLEGGDFFYSDPFVIYSARKALYNDLYIGRFDFTVKSKEGMVELEGEVDSESSSLKAEELVFKIPGVKSLDNKLIVNPSLSSKSPAVSDKEINNEVMDKLSKVKRVKIYNLESNTIGGRVTVEGTVDSIEGELAALEVARSVKGVVSVRSKISIDSSVSDGYILFATKFLLITDPRVNGFDVHLDVKDGIIILRGTVDNEETRELAVNKARGVAGSTGVISYLKIGEIVTLDEDKIADDKLADTVESTLKNDEDLGKYNIKAFSKDGLITLKGTVDSKETVIKAIEKVSSVSGVRAVKSELELE